MSILARFASIDVVQLTMASCIINGNFQNKKITNLRANTNLLETADWLPHNNREVTEELRRRERARSNEDDLNIQDAHRQRRETSITKVGALDTLEDVEKVFYNIKTFCSIVCDIPAMRAANSLPIVDQLMDFYAGLTGGAPFNEWLIETGGGPIFLSPSSSGPTPPTSRCLLTPAIS